MESVNTISETTDKFCQQVFYELAKVSLSILYGSNKLKVKKFAKTDKFKLHLSIIFQ